MQVDRQDRTDRHIQTFIRMNSNSFGKTEQKNNKKKDKVWKL